MRITLFLLLALLAGTASAQQPVIDYMLIDESKGILSVYGDFGTAQGKVWCDSVELPVLTWSASHVTAIIPDTGKGSAGRVEVGARGYRSKDRLITCWSIEISDKYGDYYGHGAGFSASIEYRINYRYDVISSYRGEQINVVRFIQPMKNSWTKQSYFEASYPDKNGNHTYTSKGYDTLLTHSSLQISNKERLVCFDLEMLLQIHTKVFAISCAKLDSSLTIIDTSYTYIRDGEKFGSKVNTLEIKFLPPQKAIALQNNPSIIAPKDKRTNLGTDNILLQWDTLKYIDGYHIQLSKDSLVNSQQSSQHQQAVIYIVDTIVSSLDFTLPHLEKNTKYYWRVCGVNSEGESRWSDVWSFTTGTSADVRSIKENISFSCYPNPTSSEMTITSPLPSSFTISNAAGQDIRKGLTQADHTKIDVSALPSGVYFIRVSGEKQAKMIQILR